MRSSITVWFKKDEVPTVDFQKDNGMVTVYLGEELEIYIYMDELRHLSERIESFLEEKGHVVFKR